jgi:uncharacterized membrane protein
VLNPFDLRSALLAKHAQHVLLVHFPIALYLSGTFSDLLMHVLRKGGMREVARWNFLAAAITSLPTAVTGILAWRLALEGQQIKGLLRMHLLLAMVAVVGMWATVGLGKRQISGEAASPPRWLLALESAVCVLLAATGHLGGFLSGVNGNP